MKNVTHSFRSTFFFLFHLIFIYVFILSSPIAISFNKRNSCVIYICIYYMYVCMYVNMFVCEYESDYEKKKMEIDVAIKDYSISSKLCNK